MSYQLIALDLDGTLLPMELEPFAKLYFAALARELAPFGLTPETMFKPFWAATKAMMGNTTGKLNSDVFWEAFCMLLPGKGQQCWSARNFHRYLVL